MLTPHPAFPRRIWLNGRPSLRGLGQLVCSDPTDPTTCIDTSTAQAPPCADDCSFVGPLQPGQVYCQSGGLTPSCPTTTPSSTTLPSTGSSSASSGGGINWTSIINGIVQGTAKGVQLSQLTNMAPGTSYTQTATGIQATGAGATATGLITSPLTSATLGNLLPIGVVAGVVLLFMMSRR